jgi:glycosyltransferase involved in cell wall biosynthesis
MRSPSVLFLLNDTSLRDIDCRNVTKGNPAIGGAEYLFVALAYELASRGLARVKLVHFTPSNLYPDTLPVLRLDSAFGSPWAPCDKEIAADFVIVRAYNDTATMAKVVAGVPGAAPIIVWAHNHLHWKTQSYLAKCERVRCIVYVGKEQAALAAASPARTKSTYIANGFYPPPAVESQPRARRAVYVGHLVPEKGFHRLARLWPRIHRECPGAALDVIGDGRLYGRSDLIGPLGLTHPRYERRILHHLDNDPAKYGVVFHGKLGISKFEIMSRSVLGLPNPTAFTECCPGSTLELSACGNAVVAPRRWGMCDTVVDGVSGCLSTTDDEYVRSAVSLLNNPERALEMGRKGQTFVRERFSFSRVCDEWLDLFASLANCAVPARPNPGPLNGSYPLQSLRGANGKLMIPGADALLNYFDRAHGWFIRKF